MKAFITRFSLLLVLGLVGLVSKAATVTVDEIIYELNDDTVTATVTGHSDGITTADIKSSVTYKGSDYIVTSIGNDAFFSYNSQTALKSVTIPNSITTIGHYSFAYCRDLKEIILPNSLISIGNMAFLQCSGLTSVIIPNSVSSVGNMAFFECSALSEVTIPTSLTKIGMDVFKGCRALRSVYYAAETPIEGSKDIFSFTSYETATLYVPAGAIERCKEIDPWKNFNKIVAYEFPEEIITIEGIKYQLHEETATAMVIGYTDGITTADIKSSVTYKGSDYIVTSIGNDAFFSYNSQTALKSVTIPNSITTIGHYSFAYCRDLKEIILPNSLISIGNMAFLQCSGLTSVIIPNSVSSVGNMAFFECSALSEVTIPTSLTKIGMGVFSFCSALRSVYYAAETPIEGSKDIFSFTSYKTATLYVPAAAVEKCKAIDPWKNFNKIAAYNFSGIDVAEANEPVVTVSNMTINVSGVADDCTVSVFTVSGQLIGSETGCCSISVANRGVYIVKVGNKVVKVAM